MRSKGFTLIELLAVIVILALIATIATPIVLGIINDTREKAFKISLNSINHAYELYTVNHTLEEGQVISVSKLPLDKKNLKGSIIVEENNKIKFENITDGTYNAKGYPDSYIVEKVTPEVEFKIKADEIKHAFEDYIKKHENDPNFDPTIPVDVKDLVPDTDLTGTIKQDENGEIVSNRLTDGTYSAEGKIDELTIIKGSTEELEKNRLDIKAIVNYNSRSIVVTVETLEGYPTSYTYKIAGPDNYSKTETTTNNTHTFNKLKVNTSYSVIVSVENKYNVKKELATITGKTTEVGEITLDLTPKDEYIKSGKVTINYPSIEGTVNKYKWDGDTEFTPVTGSSVEVTAKNGTLIAVIQDGEETVLSNQITISNVDNIPPEITLSEERKTTKSITIPYSIVEEHIDEVTCKYSDTEGKYTTSGVLGENICTLSNELEDNKTYYYEICVTDKAENKTCKTGNTDTEEVTNPEVNITHTPSNAGASTTNGYSKEEVAHITFTSTKITTPTYYIKSTIVGTTNNNVIGSCGTTDKPGTCTSLSTTNITANTWYKVSGDINVTYNTKTSENGTLYALTYDGKNYSGASTGTILKIDRTSPVLVLGTITTSTNSITIPYTITETESGVNSQTCRYGESTTYGSNGTIENNTCTITGLNNEKTYYYEICVTDKVGNDKTCKPGSTGIDKITNPGIEITHTPSNAGASTTNGYSKEEVAHITFTSTKITTPTYYIKSTIAGTINNNVIGVCGTGDKPSNCTTSSTTNITSNTWYKVSGNINVTYNTKTTTNGTVYALTYDGKNYSGASTGTILKIDRTSPVLGLGTVTTTTNSITIPYTITETESGINTETCRYGESTTYGNTGTINNNTCTITNLDNTKTYYYEICVTDKVGNEKTCKTGSTGIDKITNPGIEITHTPSNASLDTTNGYSKEEVAHITFDSTNITSPTYYIKSTIAGTTNNNVIGVCGTGDKPGTCTTTSTTNITANTWYKVSGDINVTYNTKTTTNGTIYALTYDGKNYSGASTGTILKIDTKGPEYTTSISEGNVTITSSDPAGLHSKAYSCDGSWQSSNICVFTSSGNHTVNVRDTLENEGEEDTVTISFEYHDTTSNASAPVLGSLTPVVYKNNNWVVANTSSKWHDYTNQEWANAVLLDSGVTKNVGDTVTVTGSNPEAIAMFVWIPRYEYKIEGTYGKGGTSATSPGEIEVKFIQKSKTTSDSGYRIHPAFTFGGTELDGIWVGKFETSHTSSSMSHDNRLECSNNNCSNADGLRVLPNVKSLRMNNVSNYFYATQSMDNRLNISGDLHMMKNSEWGAAAYLSQSKYGKYGNTSYSGTAKEVSRNESSWYLTGGGNYTSNIAQSTTGNITGIYDMSGGTAEYVMGVYNEIIGNSGFSSLPDAKYYDNYTSKTASTACNGGVCYGHALSETSGWYSDVAYFVSSSYPWLKRGDDYGYDNGLGKDVADAGVFAFNKDEGYLWEDHIVGYASFRVVLAPTTNEDAGSGSGSGVCFVAGTKVMSEEGLKNIEDIKVGDNVYSMKLTENDSNLGIKKVIKTFVHDTNETYILTIGNEKLEVTPNHPIYVVGKGWTKVEKIKIDDEILTYNKESLTVKDIQIKHYNEPIKVYNFKVEDYHNYFVTNQGLLVHNKDIAQPPSLE